MLPWMKGGWRVWRDALARVRLFLVFFLSHRWFYCSKTVLSIFCFEILKYPPCVFQTGPHGARHLISGNANKQTKQSEKSRLRSSNNLRRRIFLNQKKTPKKIEKRIWTPSPPPPRNSIQPDYLRFWYLGTLVIIIFNTIIETYSFSDMVYGHWHVCSKISSKCQNSKIFSS